MALELKEGERLATRDRLVRVVLDLSETRPIDEIKVEEVLGESGISTGSLYHHFDDFGHLIETAMVARYLEMLRAGELFIQSALDEAETFDDIKSRIAVISGMYAKLNTPEARFERARILARAERHERLRKALGEAQEQYTDSLAAMFERAQGEGGWINPELNPRALAVLVQAYTFGRLVDDITPNSMDQKEWIALIQQVFAGAILKRPTDPSR
jgi:AcrR family transcriptional regulator